MSIESTYSEHDGLGLAELVKKGEVTQVELVEEAIRRIETLNPQLNAVIHKMYDQARTAAQTGLPEGPFTGVPLLLKDLLAECAGEPLRSGSPANSASKSLSKNGTPVKGPSGSPA